MRPSKARLGILLAHADCGWTDECREGDLEALRAAAPRVDVLLLSHPDVAHCGGLAHAASRLGLRAVAYATGPVASAEPTT